MWSIVRELVAEGTTIFLTTQYLEEADQLAGRVGIIDDGLIVAEDTPAALKAQVGVPHLEISVDLGDADRATEICSRFGRPLPPRGGTVAVELPQGKGQIGKVVRALDDASIAVESLDLVEPSLDDVFVAKTGHRLEPAAPEDPAEEDAAEEREAVPG
jgi:ABC-2 type transport system ATP-binding protein